MNLNDIEKVIFRGETELSIAKESLKNIQRKKKKVQKKISDLETAKVFIIELGENTQREIKETLEETVTAALHSVFGPRYEKFVVEFTTKRNQPEVNFYIQEKKKLLDIKQDLLCGGVIDVVSFILRVTQWKIKYSKSPPIFILDEPFKNVSRAFRNNVSKMVKEISTNLGIQIIMVTHKTNLITSSDNIIEL